MASSSMHDSQFIDPLNKFYNSPTGRIKAKLDNIKAIVDEDKYISNTNCNLCESSSLSSKNGTKPPAVTHLIDRIQLNQECSVYLSEPEWRCRRHLHYAPCSYCKNNFNSEECAIQTQYGYHGVLCPEHTKAKRCSTCKRWLQLSYIEADSPRLCNGRHDNSKDINNSKDIYGDYSKQGRLSRLRRVHSLEESPYMTLMRTLASKEYNQLKRRMKYNLLKETNDDTMKRNESEKWENQLKACRSSRKLNEFEEFEELDSDDSSSDEFDEYLDDLSSDEFDQLDQLLNELDSGNSEINDVLIEIERLRLTKQQANQIE